MKKACLMKGMAAMAFGLVVAGCSKDVIFSQEEMTEEFGSNFEANILNGKEVDANQTWSTASSVPVQVTVDLDYGEEYTVYFYTNTPLLDEDATYVGCGTVKSGETTTVNVTLPNGAMTLYAALYDKDLHAICKPFVMEGADSKVEFSNKETTLASQVAHRAASTGNRWSVTPQNMPDLTAYTTGTTPISAENNHDRNPQPISKYLIPANTEWSENIPLIQSGAGKSVYVEGTMRLSANQSVNGACAIVVGNGGKIIIPEGIKLETNDNGTTAGMIYVMPGGSIEGDGEMIFANGTTGYSYNAGSITVKKINNNGGTLYNAGTIGKATNTTTALEGPSGTLDNPSLFVNLGQAYFTQVDGAGMAIHNACNMYVAGTLTIGKSSRMDNGSYIECGTLELHNGSSAGGVVLYMGNAAYMNCKGDVSVNNFGVWGPTSNNGGTINNAIFKINGCSYCNYNSGDATQFLLDRVELIIPQDYPKGVDAGYNGNNDNILYGIGYIYNSAPTYAAKNLFYGWFNGFAGRTIDGDNYEYVMIHDWGFDKDGNWYPAAYEPDWKRDVPLTSFADDSRATCSYGTSPSYTVTKDETENCGVDIKKGSNPLPQPNYYYYAFEDLGTTNDIDFNDVVIRVSTPDANGKSDVYLMAAGGTMPTSVIYGTGENPRVLCKEVHSALGVASVKTMVNTGSDDGEDKPIVKIGVIENLSSTTDMANLPFGIIASGNGGTVRVQRSIQNYGKVPLMIVVSGYTSGSNAGKWFWPTERTNISTAYTQFGAWGANVQSNPTWYLNYTDGTVYTW